MKHILILLIVFAGFNSVYAQQKVNLMANYFPGMVPGEAGLELYEFNYTFQTWNYVQFPTPIELTEINSDSAKIMFFSFIIAIDDTTCSYVQEYRGKIDTLHFYKDSIGLTRAEVVYFDKATNDHFIASSCIMCKDEYYKFKFNVKIEKLTRKSCHYSLYFSEDCAQPTEETLIRYGKIRFRKYRKYKIWEYH